MALNNPPRHLAELLSNVTEVGRLLSLHSAAAGNGPGRKYDVEILNKSAIVLMVACREAFVEDLATTSLEHMLRHAKSHETFPENVRERVASKNQGLNSWKLAGDGWKKVLRDNLAEVLSKTVGSLNTPKTAQVNDLFEKTIGHKQLSDKWAWSGRSAKSSTTDLISWLRSEATLRTESKPRKMFTNPM